MKRYKNPAEIAEGSSNFNEMAIYKIFFLIVWATLVSSTLIQPRAYEPQTRTFELILRKITLAPDGFSRSLKTINGQYPGPTIEVTKGDRVVMNVHNELGEPS